MFVHVARGMVIWSSRLSNEIIEGCWVRRFQVRDMCRLSILMAISLKAVGSVRGTFGNSCMGFISMAACGPGRRVKLARAAMTCVESAPKRIEDSPN
jgi:hypothetical protein